MDLPQGKSIFLYISLPQIHSQYMFSFLNPFTRLASARAHELGFELNDGGREAAGFKGGAGDCVVRAIAIAAELPYMQVYEDLRTANAVYADQRNDKLARRLAAKGASPRNGNHRNVFHDYILGHGFDWVPTMKIGAGCQVHLLANELPLSSSINCSTGPPGTNCTTANVRVKTPSKVGIIKSMRLKI